MKHRIALVTTRRSDYAALLPVMHEAFHHPALDPLLVIGGAHLEERLGLTVRDVEDDAWPIAARVPFLDRSDDDAGYARGSARAVAAFADTFRELQAEAVLLHGARWELLPIATAAVLARTPLVHLGGGELTEGAVGEQVRHALTKIAHLHFPSTALAAQRVLQMGEEPWRVQPAGDPAVDQFVRGERTTPAELARLLGFVPGPTTLLVTLHAATPDGAAELARELASALHAWEGPVVLTAPAPDPGADMIRAALQPLAQERPGTVWIESLGGRRYRGLAGLVGALVGNSSSALIEAPSVPLPAVNIGRRQDGRERARNVIDVPADRMAIVSAISEALSPAFRASLAGLRNPYGDGHAARRIVESLAQLPPPDTLLAKRFVTWGGPVAGIPETSWQSSVSGPAPVGGDFPLDWPELWDDESALFGAGRDALFAIARRHPGRWLVPAFCAPVVPRTLRAAGCEAVPYTWATPWRVEGNALSAALVSAAGMVVPFHLGLPPEYALWERVLGRGAVVVEDRCHWIGAPPPPEEIRGDYAFGSYRKWLPVPDGAWVVARDREPLRPWQTARRDMVRLRLAAALARRSRLDGRLLAHDATLERTSVELFALGEADPAAGPLGARASALGARLAAAADVEDVRTRRRRNQHALCEGLRDKRAMVLAGPETGPLPDVPMLSVPVWCPDRDAAVRALADHRVWAGLHWADGDWSGVGGRAGDWARHLLSLPVDQRYTPEDMARIAEAVE